MKHLILFLIRKRLGVKKFERFYFTNRKYPDEYYFTDDELIKIERPFKCGACSVRRPSGISLNWMLDDEAKLLLVKIRPPYDD